MTRLLTWNIHGARDASLARIADEIRTHAPDVACLNEVRRGGGERLGKMLGMRAYEAMCFIGPYGNAILTGEPGARFERLHFAGVRRVDRRDAAIVTLRDGTTVVAVHLNLRAEERARNVRQLLANVAGTAVIAGDMNEPADGAVGRLLWERFVDAGASHAAATFPAAHPVARLDQVWLSRGARVRSVVVPATSASDHLPVIVDFDRDAS